jgi:hypothetical protein
VIEPLEQLEHCPDRTLFDSARREPPLVREPLHDLISEDLALLALFSTNALFDETRKIPEGIGEVGACNNRQEAFARPQNERAAPIGPLERGALVAGRFSEILLVRLQIIEDP